MSRKGLAVWNQKHVSEALTMLRDHLIIRKVTAKNRSNLEAKLDVYVLNEQN